MPSNTTPPPPHTHTHSPPPLSPMQLKLREAVVSDVRVRFQSGEAGKAARGRTKEGVILRHMGTRRGKLYSVTQVMIGDINHIFDYYL